MRRIIVTEEELANVKLRDLMETLDYFYVKIRRDGLPRIGAFVCNDDHDVYFCCDLPAFDGCYCNLREDLGFEYSWDCSAFSYAEELVTDNDCGCEFLGLASQGEIASLDSNLEESSAMFIHNEYSQHKTYRKIHGYHEHQGENFNDLVSEAKDDHYRIGVELEVECKSRALYEEVTRNVKSNWVFMERDGSLNSYGIEFITIPLLPKHAKSKATWTDLTEYLKTRAVSWDRSNCGLHVHIGRGILGSTAEEQSETIGKLLYLYHHFMKHHSLNVKIFGRSTAYNDHEGMVAEGESVKSLGSECLIIKSVKDKVKNKLIERASSSRYFDVNTDNRHTIEFRKGRGSINPLRITAVVEWCELYCLYARKAKWQNISDTDFLDFVHKKMKKSGSLSHYIGGADADC